MLSEVLNLHADGLLEQRTNALRHDRELWHQAYDDWPVGPGVSVESVCSVRRGERYDALMEREHGAARLRIDGGIAHVSAFGRSEQAAGELLEQLRAEIPRAEDSDPDLVPVTFWTYSVHGPQSIRRLIDAPAFDDIEDNYPGAGELLSLLHDWTPGTGGQLLLWHGEAGTGKTTMLRSLGREWSDWAELHYIVDPDKFFGESASYMMNVMMGDGGMIEGEATAPKWRVLVLEDCAEMLAPDARREVGQALSRLLNACDGLIGRGLRLLILITTNEPLEKVHPAISRPGRCAARLEFEPFNHITGREWLDRHGHAGGQVAGSATLADLYAIRDGHRTQDGRRPVGFVT
jgi:hypothetical protein